MTDTSTMSEAEAAARVQLMDGAAPLHCDNCGRDCKHIPQAPGGGTAGGAKETKWAPSDRSTSQCPSCGQKPHRKEGRPQQMHNCLVAQVALHNGLTGFPRPSSEFAKMTLDYLDAGLYKEPPTEQIMNLIVNGATAEDAYKIVEARIAERLAKQATKGPKAPKLTKGQIENVVAAPGEENEEAATAPGTPIAFGAPNGAAPVSKLNLKAEIPEEPTKKAKSKKEKKAEKAARLLARAEETTEEEAPENDGSYDPFANVGQPFAVTAE